MQKVVQCLVGLTVVLLVLLVMAVPALALHLPWNTDCNCHAPITNWVCKRCFGSCPRTLDPVNRFQQLTLRPGAERRLVGQDTAAGLIADALRTANGQKPLTFHFCGENGVGKSHTALLLAQASFEYKNKRTGMPRGLLWISGKQYQMVKSPEEIKAAGLQIHQQIFEHLDKCPQAIVVVDEAEMMRADILRVLGGFMDDTHTVVSSMVDPGRSVSTKSAIIILISDFGRDEIRVGDSWDNISERVTRETKAILQEDLMVQRIQHVIPFLPMPGLNCTARIGTVSEPVEELVTMLVRQLKSHPTLVQDGIVVQKVGADVHAIGEKLMHFMVAHEHYCERNYRGIEGLFGSKIVGPVLKQLPPPRPNEAHQEVVIHIKVPFDTSTVSLVQPGGREDL